MTSTRRLQYKWTHKEAENLIKEVKKREGLWNPAVKNYKDRNLRCKLWEDIAKEMGLSRHEVTTKWNGVRNSYRTHWNRMIKSPDGLDSSVSTNTVYRSLKFLDPVMSSERNTPNHTSSNVSENSFIHVPLKEEILDDHNENVDNVIDCPDDMEESDENFSTTHTETEPKVSSNSDAWNVIGNFVAFNGREWEKNNPKLAHQFKVAIYKLLADFEEKATILGGPVKMIQ